MHFSLDYWHVKELHLLHDFDQEISALLYELTCHMRKVTELIYLFKDFFLTSGNCCNVGGLAIVRTTFLGDEDFFMLTTLLSLCIKCNR